MVRALGVYQFVFLKSCNYHSNITLLIILYYIFTTLKSLDYNVVMTFRFNNNNILRHTNEDLT